MVYSRRTKKGMNRIPVVGGTELVRGKIICMQEFVIKREG